MKEKNWILFNQETILLMRNGLAQKRLTRFMGATAL